MYECSLHLQQNICLHIIIFLFPFTISEEHIFKEDDLEYEQWEKGDKFKIAIVKVNSHNVVGVLRPDSDLLRHIQSNLTPKISSYCCSSSFDTYIPRALEVCLVKYDGW